MHLIGTSFVGTVIGDIKDFGRRKKISLLFVELADYP
jgi:hypothetical protein